MTGIERFEIDRYSQGRWAGADYYSRDQVKRFVLRLLEELSDEDFRWVTQDASRHLLVGLLEAIQPALSAHENRPHSHPPTDDGLTVFGG